jgi:hypothetical protein
MAGEMDCMYFIAWDFDEERGMIFYEKIGYPNFLGGLKFRGLTLGGYFH